jgi:hypothetical protein
MRKKSLVIWPRNTKCGPNSAVSPHRLFSSGRSVLESDEYVYSESSIAEIHSLRENAVRDDIARRLKGVCSNLSDDEFDKLVRLMAVRQIRCERRQSW